MCRTRSNNCWYTWAPLILYMYKLPKAVKGGGGVNWATFFFLRGGGGLKLKKLKLKMKLIRRCDGSVVSRSGTRRKPKGRIKVSLGKLYQNKYCEKIYFQIPVFCVFPSPIICSRLFFFLSFSFFLSFFLIWSELYQI